MKTRKILITIVILLTAIFFNIETVNATSEEHIITKLASSESSESGSSTLTQTIEDGNEFIEKGGSGDVHIVTSKHTKTATNAIYGVLMLFGIISAVIVGLIIGIKYMMSTVEVKADVKKQLVVYLIGCAVLFGAITIWRTVVTLLNNAM